MTLDEYRKNRDLTHEQLATQLGLKRGTVYNICRAKGDVSLVNAVKIIKKTGGIVMYEDLLKVN